MKVKIKQKNILKNKKSVKKKKKQKDNSDILKSKDVKILKTGVHVNETASFPKAPTHMISSVQER